MAKLDESLASRIDWLLGYQQALWEELPQVAREIDTWDEVEMIDYLVEWTPRQQLLDELEEYARDGGMTAAQRQRYAQLRALVARHRPILEELLAG